MSYGMPGKDWRFGKHFGRCLLIFLCLGIFSGSTYGQVTETLPALNYPVLVKRFDSISKSVPDWSMRNSKWKDYLQAFLTMVNNTSFLGLDGQRYHYNFLYKQVKDNDTTNIIMSDKVYLDGLISWCKDMYQGVGIDNWIRNDEVSGQSADVDNAFILNLIANISFVDSLMALRQKLEPRDTAYFKLASELKWQTYRKDRIKIDQLVSSVNLYKWIHHFNFNSMILVNIPAAHLDYYEHDSLKLDMKVVAGKPKTKSPRFSTWCYQVVLYPYWNVPKDIAVKEILPRVKRNPGTLKSMNMEVISATGKVVSPQNIDWSKLNNYNFPYSFRQCTGCENSLGVIKFNLTDPFSVYLHDTNYKLGFLKDTRFLSHGCIRVEKPYELGNYLLDNKLDSNFLKACYKDKEPIFNDLKEKVPVFVVYMPAEFVGDSVVYYKDVYGLFR